MSAPGSLTPSGRQVARAAAAAQGVTGLALLLAPRTVTRVVSRSASAPAPWLVRLLGTRMAVQGAMQGVLADREVLWAGAAVDAAHGASMVAAAVLLPRYRRPAATSAVVALTSAGLGVALAAGPGPRR